MKILYAPSKRVFSDDLHANVVCGFDVMVLDSILESKSGEVLFLPHKETSLKITETILNIFGSSIQKSDEMVEADVLVSDISALALEHALWMKNPSILCLFGFNDIQFPQNDRYYALIDNVSYCVYSLKMLKEALLNYENIKVQKIAKIEEFLQGAIL